MAKIATPAHHRFFSLTGIELFTELSRIKNDGSASEKGSLTRWLKTEGCKAHLQSQFSRMDMTQEQAHRALFESLMKIATA